MAIDRRDAAGRYRPLTQGEFLLGVVARSRREGQALVSSITHSPSAPGARRAQYEAQAQRSQQQQEAASAALGSLEWHND